MGNTLGAVLAIAAGIAIGYLVLTGRAQNLANLFTGIPTDTAATKAQTATTSSPAALTQAQQIVQRVFNQVGTGNGSQPLSLFGYPATGGN